METEAIRRAKTPTGTGSDNLHFSKKTLSNHYKGKKAAVSDSNEGNKQELEALTGLVDQLSRKGYYDIYSDPYEKIAFKLKQLNEKPKGKFTVVAMI